jgi:hypothetical protein
MIVASYLSNDVLNTQMAASEFKTAQNLVISIESEIHKLIFKSGSSTVIKTSFARTAPGYTRSGKNMSVAFSGTPTKNFLVGLNFLNMEGQQEIGGSFIYDILGDTSMIVTPYNGSLGRVHVSKPRNWRVSLDYERALYSYTGRVNLYGALTNTIEVTVVILDLGEFDVTDNSIIIIQNEGIETETFIRTGNFSLTVSPPSGEGTPKTVYLTDMGGDPLYGSRVNFHRVYIKISVQEGG